MAARDCGDKEHRGEPKTPRATHPAIISRCTWFRFRVGNKEADRREDPQGPTIA